MTARSRHRIPPFRAVCLASFLLACQPAAIERPRPDPDGGRVITAEAIARSGATDAWDALKRTGVLLSLGESWNGDPSQLQSRRGRSSIVLRNSDTPLVVLDGTRLNDIRTLRQIAAQSISQIRILSGIEGTTYEGTNAGAGVIMIVSKMEPDD